MGVVRVERKQRGGEKIMVLDAIMVVPVINIIIK